jgi:hypothetical protein
MKKRAIYVLATTAFTAAAFAQQQIPSATAANPSVAPGASQTQPAKPNTPPTDPTATTSTSPAPPASANEDKSVTPNSQAAGSQSNAAQQSAQTQKSQLPQSDASVASLDTSGLTSAQLQQKIESALHSEPTLSGSDLTVNVTDDEIDITGTTGSSKDRTTASRIVNSFGENRKVKEKINVSGVKK